jgi:hypothetical protein
MTKLRVLVLSFADFTDIPNITLVIVREAEAISLPNSNCLRMAQSLNTENAAYKKKPRFLFKFSLNL